MHRLAALRKGVEPIYKLPSEVVKRGRLTLASRRRIHLHSANVCFGAVGAIDNYVDPSHLNLSHGGVTSINLHAPAVRRVGDCIHERCTFALLIVEDLHCENGGP